MFRQTIFSAKLGFLFFGAVVLSVLFRGMSSTDTACNSVSPVQSFRFEQTGLLQNTQVVETISEWDGSEGGDDNALIVAVQILGGQGAICLQSVDFEIAEIRCNEHLVLWAPKHSPPVFNS